MKTQRFLYAVALSLVMCAALPALGAPVKIAEWVGVNSGVTTQGDAPEVTISDLSLVGGAKNTSTAGDIWGMNNVNVVGAGMSFTVSADGAVIEDATVESNVQASNTGPIEMVWKVNGVQVAVITKTKAAVEDFSSNLGTLEDGDVVTLEYDGSLSVTGGTPSNTGTFRFRPTLEIWGTVVASGPPVLRVRLDQDDGFKVTEGNSLVVTATASNGEEPYSFDWDTDLGAAFYSINNDKFTIKDSAPLGDYYLEVLVTDDESETADAYVEFSVVEPVEEPDVFIDFESGTLATAYAEATSTLEDGKVWAHERTVRGNLAAEKKIGAYSARIAPLNNTNAYLALSEPYEADISSISFLLASYGTDSMANVVLTVEVSSDGVNWTVVKTFEGTADIPSELTEQVIDEIPAGARYVKFFATSQIAGNTKRVNIDNIEISFGSSGPAELSVSFDKADNFSIEQGEGATITATAKGGEAPYWYLWGTSLLEHWDPSGNQFTIRPTAPVGDYEATVYVTDNAETEIEKTINFSITAPAPKYAITVNAGANGSATTTPAGEAAAGVEVTINPQANIGYAVDAITVTAADSSNVPVSNNKFTMPAQAVTVAVSFKEASGETYIVDFEGAGETKTAYASATVTLNGKDWNLTDTLIGTTDDDWKNDARSARFRGYGTSVMTLEEDIPGISSISFEYRQFGTAQQVAWKVEYSADGTDPWTQVGSDFTATDTVQTFSETISDPSAARVRIRQASGTGTANRQMNVDDIEIVSGPVGPKPLGVAFDKEDGFKVNEGSSAVITATASGGTAPYDYTWSSSLGAAYYSASGNQFTVLGTAAVGSYWAKVEVEDDDAGAVDKTINFTVSEPSAEPDAFIDFETKTLPAGYAASTALLEDGKMWSTIRVAYGRASDADKMNGDHCARIYPTNKDGEDAILQQAEPYDADIASISFLLAHYGTDNLVGAEMRVEVSADGSDWDIVATFGKDDVPAELTEQVLDEIPAGARYIRFYATAGAATGKRFNVDDISVSFGESGPKPLSVSFDKAEGFSVVEGNSAVITATASGGEAPYTDYEWSTDLPAADYSASANVFTIKASAALGDYWAKVVVTDNAEDTADKTINFSVVDVPLDVAILPIAEAHTVSNDWAGMTGWSGVSMGGYTDGRAQFNANNDSLTVNFDSTPGTLTFDIKGNTASTGEAPMEFLVEESTDGVIWSEVDTIDETQVSTSYASFGPYDLNEHSRYVRWTYVNKFAFNLGLNNVYITKGEGGGPGPGVEIVVTGSLTGTVGEELVLGVELLEAVADDWTFELTDPNDDEDWDYDWDPETGAFWFTPTLVGTYTLEIEAMDEGWSTIATKTVYLVISEAGPAPDFPIESIVYVPANGTLSFDIPAGATATVYGASEVVGGGWNWVELTLGTDYTISGNTISINTTGGVPAARMIRIGK